MDKVIFRSIGLLAFFLVLFLNLPLTFTEAKTVVADQGEKSTKSLTDQSLTIYNQNKAVIKQKRWFDLEKVLIV